MTFQKHHDRVQQIGAHQTDDDRLQYLHQLPPAGRKTVITVDQEEHKDAAAKYNKD